MGAEGESLGRIGGEEEAGRCYLYKFRLYETRSVGDSALLGWFCAVNAGILNGGRLVLFDLVIWFFFGSSCDGFVMIYLVFLEFECSCSLILVVEFW